MVQMNILGAGHEVGRSGFLIKHKQSNILLDYGVKLTPDGVVYPEYPKGKIQSIVLSHAHLDHSGMIPAIYARSNPYLYLTAPSLDLADILWKDTLKIAKYDGVEPPYIEEEIVKAHKRAQVISYKQNAQIAPNIEISMYDAGHILGSALTKVEFDNDKTLLYTGDYKLNETRLHKGADVDIEDDNLDYLIVESTYGDRDHPNRKEVEEDFAKSIKETLDNGGNVVIAAFALGRSQEIVDILNDYNITKYPIYLDGMGQRVSNVYMKYPGYYKSPFHLRESLGKTIWIKNHKMRKKAIKEQSIIVTTAGMLEGGPILYYLKEIYNDPKSAVFMTGFQVPETKGHTLLDTGKIEIDDKLYIPKCQIKKFDFSAHLGRDELFKTISHWNPKKVICVHGDDKIVDKFKTSIEEDLGIKAIAPRVGDNIDLDE